MRAPIFLLNDDPKATADHRGDHLLDVSLTDVQSIRTDFQQRVNYLRATFAGTHDTMSKGLAILETTLCDFFAE
jgi:hypothetical protein